MNNPCTHQPFEKRHQHQLWSLSSPTYIYFKKTFVGFFQSLADNPSSAMAKLFEEVFQPGGEFHGVFPPPPHLSAVILGCGVTLKKPGWKWHPKKDVPKKPLVNGLGLLEIWSGILLRLMYSITVRIWWFCQISWFLPHGSEVKNYHPVMKQQLMAVFFKSFPDRKYNRSYSPSEIFHWVKLGSSFLIWGNSKLAFFLRGVFFLQFSFVNSIGTKESETFFFPNIFRRFCFFWNLDLVDFSPKSWSGYLIGWKPLEEGDKHGRSQTMVNDGKRVKPLLWIKINLVECWDFPISFQAN